MPKSKELFIIQDGKPTDAPLHESILAAGDEAAALEVGIAQARKAGLTEAQIALLYPTRKPKPRPHRR
jgi:hypothetical protein